MRHERFDGEALDLGELPSAKCEPWQLELRDSLFGQIKENAEARSDQSSWAEQKALLERQFEEEGLDEAAQIRAILGCKLIN